jgi:uncharacterized Rossmann fold enzyme
LFAELIKTQLKEFEMNSVIRALKMVKRIGLKNYEKAKWRLDPEFRHSNAKLRALRNAHVGQKAVIMCNGPSLNLVNLGQLKGTFVFGLNKINLMFDRTDFRPDMVVAVNKYVIEQNRDFFKSTSIPVVLSHRSKDEVGSAQHLAYVFMQGGGRFSENSNKAVYEGWTVTHAALQLAFHMGFRKIALVGADHTFAQKGKPNELVVASGPDQNHFHPNYFGKGTPWQLADLEGSERAYREARSSLERHGGTIYNCTDGGKLEIFERLTLQQFLDL